APASPRPPGPGEEGGPLGRAKQPRCRLDPGRVAECARRCTERDGIGIAVRKEDVCWELEVARPARRRERMPEGDRDVLRDAVGRRADGRPLRDGLHQGEPVELLQPAPLCTPASAGATAPASPGAAAGEGTHPRTTTGAVCAAR